MNKLVSNLNLSIIESVDSFKIAGAINKACEKVQRDQIDILIQVVAMDRNSSKHGTRPSEVTSLVHHIKHTCPHLSFRGLMSTGQMSDPSEFR